MPQNSRPSPRLADLAVERCDGLGLERPGQGRGDVGEFVPGLGAVVHLLPVLGVPSQNGPSSARAEPSPVRTVKNGQHTSNCPGGSTKQLEQHQVRPN